MWERFLPQPKNRASNSLFAAALARRRALVTGAGGYIGRALAQAIAAAGPQSLVLLDSSEQNLFEIHRSLSHAEPILGSVSDAPLLDAIFTRFAPEIVFHAAAFKHVPLLESNPFAAIENNALGTYQLAQAAVRYGVAKLVLVSTDKAVNPHSIMGASKRIAELVIAALSTPECRMNAVRLGNVIGSTGSVVPAFLQQIAEGGPLTVTHSEVSRYFLTLPETVDAILAAGAATCEGRILVPELGAPVRIADLARFLIGDRAIPIRFTGLRPGDKLAEETSLAEEIPEGLADGALSVFQTRRLSAVQLEGIIEGLAASVRARDLPALLESLATIIPKYVPSALLTEAASAVSGSAR